MPPMTILIHSVAANAVSNPPRAVNAANAVYEEEQRPELNVAFAVAPQGVDNLFRYDTAATMHVCKDHDRFITLDRKSTRLNSSHERRSRMPSSA